MQQRSVVVRLRAFLVALGLVLGGVIGMATPAHASAPVLLSGSSWLGGNGVNVCTNNGGGGNDPDCGGQTQVGNVHGMYWQCVELAQRLYQARGWHSGIFSGVPSGAYQIYDAASANGFTRQANGSITSIVPGDMIVHGSNEPYSGGAGHVSIVDSVVGSTVNVVEQNTYNDDPTGQYTFSGGTLTRSGSGTIRGVVHDPQNTNTGSGTPVTVVSSNVFYVNNTWDTQHDFVTTYGNPGAKILVGDWNGNGVDTLAMRVGNTFYMNDDFDTQHNMVTSYGNTDSEIFTGDWNGDGVDTLAMRVGNVFYVNNAWDAQHDFTIAFGNPGTEIVVGDWDGDGDDTFGMRVGNTFYMNNNFDGSHDFTTSYGNPGQKVLVGDWNGNGVDTLGVRVGNTFYMNDDFDTQHNMVTNYGNPENEIYVGDWDDDGVTTLAMRGIQ